MMLTPPSTALATTHVFIANGLYDPDITGTGIQPMGFDQMMVFYEHYTVFNARITVTFRNFSANTSPIVFLAARGDLTNIPDPVTVMETGNCISTQLMPGGVTGSLKELKLSVRVGSFLGIDDLMDSNVVRGDISSNPTEGVYFHVGCFNNETLVAGSVSCQARLEYDAVFSEARVITPSLSRMFQTLAVAADSESKSTQSLTSTRAVESVSASRRRECQVG